MGPVVCATRPRFSVVGATVHPSAVIVHLAGVGDLDVDALLDQVRRDLDRGVLGGCGPDVGHGRGDELGLLLRGGEGGSEPLGGLDQRGGWWLGPAVESQRYAVGHRTPARATPWPRRSRSSTTASTRTSISLPSRKNRNSFAGVEAADA